MNDRHYYLCRCSLLLLDSKIVSHCDIAVTNARRRYFSSLEKPLKPVLLFKKSKLLSNQLSTKSERREPLLGVLVHVCVVVSATRSRYSLVAPRENNLPFLTMLVRTPPPHSTWHYGCFRGDAEARVGSWSLLTHSCWWMLIFPYSHSSCNLPMHLIILSWIHLSKIGSREETNKHQRQIQNLPHSCHHLSLQLGTIRRSLLQSYLPPLSICFLYTHHIWHIDSLPLTAKWWVLDLVASVRSLLEFPL